MQLTTAVAVVAITISVGTVVAVLSNNVSLAGSIIGFGVALAVTLRRDGDKEGSKTDNGATSASGK
ncbi:MAG TPA: hypothetical protein VNT01_00620 [Symbiobacteriaceae bacterium]|nr:hypothetical protein [Symbiobacteriaceae bacterium]